MSQATVQETGREQVGQLHMQRLLVLKSVEDPAVRGLNEWAFMQAMDRCREYDLKIMAGRR